jgi:hypothetical protein
MIGEDVADGCSPPTCFRRVCWFTHLNLLERPPDDHRRDLEESDVDVSVAMSLYGGAESDT